MNTVLNNLLEINGTISDRLGAYIGAGLAMVGAAGAGAGQGIAAGMIAQAIARNPEAGGRIMQAGYVMAAIAESSSIYALIVSILLIFVATPVNS